jgi:dihydrofolate synthase / folylpolyglutamate synthase
VHVAGTNGKGSVTAMVHAALVNDGVRAARYTSPHLVDLAERFVVGFDPVDAATLEAAAADVLDCTDRLQSEQVLAVPPTFFEATTALAFELFRREQVEVAVIEVGLGGRFDATNVLAPPVGVIASIGLDHQQHLGDTLDAIAFEKAGIIKGGMTVVTGGLPAEAMATVTRVARERGARLLPSMDDTRLESTMQDGRAIVTIETPVERYGPVALGLRGEHQIENAVVAVRAIEALRDHGWDISKDAVEGGLNAAEWPARLEVFELPGGKRVLLDAAHNVDGARALAHYLKAWHPERPALVAGVMRDKDIDGIFAALLPVTSSIVTTAADTSRAMPARELADRIRSLRVRDPQSSDSSTVRAEEDPIIAVTEALSHADTVCVAGSIFLAGAVRDAIKRRAILR